MSIFKKKTNHKQVGLIHRSTQYEGTQNLNSQDLKTQDLSSQIVTMKSLIELSQNENEELIKRLYEMGLYPGLEVQIIGQVSFGGVFIIQFDQTRLALNTQEVTCLLGR